jgi:RRNA methylase, YACO B.subtilis ortholog
MYTKTNLTGDMAVVIGNEEKGISRLVKEECDILVKIPMIGKVQSLNASVSAGIIIYEIVRQRLEKKQ